MESQSILDMCCGSRMFWFNKRDERAVFADIRAEGIYCATVAAWSSVLTSLLIFVRYRSLMRRFRSWYLIRLTGTCRPNGLDGQKVRETQQKTWRSDLAPDSKRRFGC